jgi:hypothetical protein
VTQLAQAYIHLKPYSASDKHVRSLGRYAKRLAVKTAADIYGGDVEIEVQIEEGSLITRVTVIGSILLGSYGFVANYKGFKEGVVEMCSDAQEFAVDVCKPFIKKAGVPKEDVYRFERRLKTPGKLYRLSKRLEKLEHSVEALSPRDVRQELGNLRLELASIEEQLTPEERQALEPILKRPKLPAPREWPIVDEPKVAVLRDEDPEFRLFRELAETIPVGHSPRVLFREKAKVPHKRGSRRSKRRNADSPRLLS